MLQISILKFSRRFFRDEKQTDLIYGFIERRIKHFFFPATSQLWDLFGNGQFLFGTIAIAAT